MFTNLSKILTLLMFITCVNVWAQTGSALDFDAATSSRVVIPNSNTINLRTYSIEMWFKWGNTGTTVNFLCGKAGEQMEIHTGGPSSNNIRFIPATSVYFDAGVNAIPIGNWVHLVCIYDPSNSFAKMYINGNDIAYTKTGSNPLSTVSTSTSPLIIGMRGSGALPYQGQIDEFRLWNRVLTQAEIRSKMFCEVPNSAHGLVINYHFNQGTASGTNTNVLIDDSGYNNNGTLSGFALTGGFSNFISPGAIPNGATCSITGNTLGCNTSTLTAIGGAASYAWSGGVSPNTASNTFTTTGLYTVTVTSPTSITSTFTESVFIATTPVVPSTQTFCGFSSVANLSATGTNLKWYGSANAVASLASDFPLQNGASYFVSENLAIASCETQRAQTNVSFDTFVNQLPVSATVCSGLSSSFTISATGTGISYLWNTGVADNTITTSIAGNYLVTVSGACGNYISNSVSLVLNPLTTIVSQPLATATVCSGVSQSFDVSALGGSLSYTWSNGLSATRIMTTSVAGNNYTVTVNGACGPPAVSESSILIVDPFTLTKIEGQPVASAIICFGSSQTLTVSATGGNLTYVWSNGLSTTNTMITSIAGSNYRVTVSGACGNPVISNASTLSLNPNSKTDIVVQPLATATVCSGLTKAFTVSATGNNLSYVWSNGLSSTNTMSTSVAGINYKVTVSGFCGSPVASSVSILVVNPLTSIITQPISATVCSGLTKNFTVSATGINLNYLWSDGVSISNVLSTSIAGINYRVTVSGACGNPLISDSISLLVNPLTVIQSLPTNITLCSGFSTTVNATASGIDLTYLWSNGVEGKSINISTTGVYLVAVTGACGFKFSNAVQVTVNDCFATGVDDLLSTINFKLYPNPSNGIFTIENTDLTDINYVISSTDGKSLKSGILQSGINAIETNLPKGFYFININNIVSKIIIE